MSYAGAVILSTRPDGRVVEARWHLPHNHPPRPPRRVSLAQVIEHVAWEFDVNPAAIDGGRRGFTYRIARLAFVWLARRHTDASGLDLAAQLGSHVQSTTVWHREAQREMEDDPWISTRVDLIDDALFALALEATA